MRLTTADQKLRKFYHCKVDDCVEWSLHPSDSLMPGLLRLAASKIKKIIGRERADLAKRIRNYGLALLPQPINSQPHNITRSQIHRWLLPQTNSGRGPRRNNIPWL